jgi:hypothetical protein
MDIELSCTARPWEQNKKEGRAHISTLVTFVTFDPIVPWCVGGRVKIIEIKEHLN